MFQNNLSTAAPVQTAEGGFIRSTAEGGCIRSMGRPMRNHRLGDLLVASGLISEDQLGQALSVQKQSKEQLGKILVRKGFISAVQLYRKLAEQWCLKASAAGLTLMMQTFTPSIARADDSGMNNVRLAAAFSPAANAIKPEMARPRLFGSTEIKSNDISAFTKWTTVMNRFESQMKSNASGARMDAWKAELASLKGRSDREKIEGVNNFLNSVRYIEDKNNWGKSDYWATPVEFMTKGGDCEDFAVAKYASLRALGFSTDQLRIAIVHDKIKNIPHAVLIVYSDDGTFILDNQDKSLRYVSDVNRYRPVFSINSSNWWLHRTPAGA